MFSHVHHLKMAASIKDVIFSLSATTAGVAPHFSSDLPAPSMHHQHSLTQILLQADAYRLSKDAKGRL